MLSLIASAGIAFTFFGWFAAPAVAFVISCFTSKFVRRILASGFFFGLFGAAIFALTIYATMTGQVF